MLWQKFKHFANSRKRPSWKSHWGKVYIIPTRYGLLFLGGAFLLILIGAAYQNNLVNLIAYFMLGLSLTGMLKTHFNLLGLEVTRIETRPGFANQDFTLYVHVQHKKKTAKQNIDFKVSNFKLKALYDGRFLLNPGVERRLVGSFMAPDRGKYQIDSLTLSTTSPLGLFYAWCYQPAQLEITIYPEPKGQQLWKTAQAVASQGSKASQGSEEFLQHRAYQENEDSRKIDWQIYAKSRALYVKEFTSDESEKVVFNYHSLTKLNAEERLCQISQWVQLANLKRKTFEVILPQNLSDDAPSMHFGPGSGAPYAHQIWSELAKFPREKAS